MIAGQRLGQGPHIVQALPEPAADHRAGGVRGVAGQRDPARDQPCRPVLRRSGCRTPSRCPAPAPAPRATGSASSPPRSRPGAAGRRRQRPRCQAAVDRLAVKQTRRAQQLALLRVVPDHVEAAVPDRRLARRARDGVGHQTVGARVHLAGGLAGGGSATPARHDAARRPWCATAARRRSGRRGAPGRRWRAPCCARRRRRSPGRPRRCRPRCTTVALPSRSPGVTVITCVSAEHGHARKRAACSSSQPCSRCHAVPSRSTPCCTGGSSSCR